jgi:hypothetical protein
MSDEQNRKMGPRGRRPGPTPGQKKENGQTYIISIDGKKFKVSPGYGDGDLEEMKFSKGGRAGLKGGGICKRGMNRKAVGKNS